MPFCGAIIEGRKAGILGIVIALAVGLVLGIGAVSGMRELFKWVSRHRQFGKQFSTPVWITIDILLFVMFFVLMIAICLLGGFITKSIIHNVAA